MCSDFTATAGKKSEREVLCGSQERLPYLGRLEPRNEGGCSWVQRLVASVVLFFSLVGKVN